MGADALFGLWVHGILFDRDGDGYIDYYEFVAALHPNKDAYRPTTDADKIEDEVWRI